MSLEHSSIDSTARTAHLQPHIPFEEQTLLAHTLLRTGEMLNQSSIHPDKKILKISQVAIRTPHERLVDRSSLDLNSLFTDEGSLGSASITINDGLSDKRRYVHHPETGGWSEWDVSSGAQYDRFDDDGDILPLLQSRLRNREALSELDVLSDTAVDAAAIVNVLGKHLKDKARHFREQSLYSVDSWSGTDRIARITLGHDTTKSSQASRIKITSIHPIAEGIVEQTLAYTAGRSKKGLSGDGSVTLTTHADIPKKGLQRMLERSDLDPLGILTSADKTMRQLVEHDMQTRGRKDS